MFEGTSSVFNTVIYNVGFTYCDHRNFDSACKPRLQSMAVFDEISGVQD